MRHQKRSKRMALQAPLTLGIVALLVGGGFAAPAMAAPDDELTFPDESVRTCVAYGLTQDPSVPIKLSDVARLKSLSCSNFTSLNGLEQFTALTELNINGSQVTSLAPLASLPNLTSLSASNTNLTSFEEFAKLPHITNLTAERLTSGVTDITALGQMTQLEYLDIPKNNITDISALANLTNLKQLDMADNKVTDLSPLSGVTSLEKYLNVSGNGLVDIAPLANLTNLQQLSIAWNKIEDVSPIAGMTNLNWIDGRGNKIADLQPLSGAKGLRTAEFSQNEISDVSVIDGLAHVTHLTLDRNRITSIAPLASIDAPQYVRLADQEVFLADIRVGAAQKNPVRGVQNQILPVTSTTATYDQATESWSFAAPQQGNSLKWSYDTGIGNYGVFSGTIYQTSVDGPVGTAELTLEKTGSAEAVKGAGDNVTYIFKVTNTGDVAVGGLAVVEVDFDGDGTLEQATCPETELEPTKSVSCTAKYAVTQKDMDRGSLTNTAKATAKTVDGDDVASQESTAVVPLGQKAQLAISKKADVTSVKQAGDKIQYTFDVKNTGNVTLSDAEVVEKAFTGSGEVSALTCGDRAELAPGKSFTCTASYEVQKSDLKLKSIENTAAATAKAPNGDAVQSKDATATVKVTKGVTPPVEPPIDPPTTKPGGKTPPVLAKTGGEGPDLLLAFGAPLAAMGAVLVVLARRKSRASAK